MYGLQKIVHALKITTQLLSTVIATQMDEILKSKSNKAEDNIFLLKCILVT